jgi:hypothetical protein
MAPYPFGLAEEVKSSYFLGDPPPDPRFLASLGALSLVEHDHCFVVDLIHHLDKSEGLVSRSSLGMPCLALHQKEDEHIRRRERGLRGLSSRNARFTPSKLT